jgi:nitrogen regulatory protein P-II 1
MVMKKIEAIIRPEKVGVVRSALEEAGYAGLMISRINGHGKQRGIIQQWRGEEMKIDLLPKMKLEIVVDDTEVRRLTGVIILAAKSGQIGDGKIFISPVENAIRIRTGEEGNDAIR